MKPPRHVDCRKNGMDFAQVRSAVTAAEGAVEKARQRLVEAQAVLAQARAIEVQNRSLLLGEELKPGERQSQIAPERDN
jgi:hypothetical protein